MAGAAARRRARREGPDRRRRAAHPVRLERARRRAARRRRRPGGRPAARGRRRRRGQAAHPGVRARPHRRRLGHRARPTTRTTPRRITGGSSSGSAARGRGRVRAAGAGHRHRLQRAHARGALRGRRAQAGVRARAARRACSRWPSRWTTSGCSPPTCTAPPSAWDVLDRGAEGTGGGIQAPGVPGLTGRRADATSYWQPADPVIAEAWRRRGRGAGAGGAKIVEVRTAECIDELAATYPEIVGAEAYTTHAALARRAPGRLPADRPRAAARRRRPARPPLHRRPSAAAAGWSPELRAALAGVDVLLTADDAAAGHARSGQAEVDGVPVRPALLELTLAVQPDGLARGVGADAAVGRRAAGRGAGRRRRGWRSAGCCGWPRRSRARRRDRVTGSAAAH